MDGNSEDDDQAHANGRQLAFALLLSLMFHTLLLSLTFGDAEFGLPGLNVFWREQKMEAPSLRVELALPANDAPVEPPPVVVMEQRKVARVVTRRIVLPPAEPKHVVMAAAPRPDPAPVQLPEPEPIATVPPIELPKQEANPDQARTALLEKAQQEVARQEAARAEAERRELDRRELERQEAARKEAEKQDVARQDAERRESERIEAARIEAERLAAEHRAAELEARRQEAARREAVRIEVERREAARLEAERREAMRLEAERREAQHQEALRLEAARAAAREEEERREARLRAIGRQLDEEAAQRDAAAKLPRSLSTARRLRLLARTDPNEELVQYAEAMARKIQLNTPADLVRDLARRPHTDPLVMLAIRSDGSVESLTIVVSSGVPEIDAAIRSIVQSHAPYQAFPPGLARQADVVEVRRTWYFDVAVRLN